MRIQISVYCIRLGLLSSLVSAQKLNPAWESLAVNYQGPEGIVGAVKQSSKERRYGLEVFVNRVRRIFSHRGWSDTVAEKFVGVDSTSVGKSSL
ncbi:hypothetical protein CA13_21870 [Planctomycetes bacterium CA13]|uniref:Uncharacterized protein n=1 Tax=Novipirellula herctigrandis TaxID=2527986 RepID=A0A5C5Z1P2_9BACT|nr:hypothetical protein CA13_21870 [Planctomycetes bacterium CA13]